MNQTQLMFDEQLGDVRRPATGRPTALRAVLFDMDGTLTDTETMWTIAFHRMAAELGGCLSDVGRAKMVGQSFATSVRLLHQETGIDGDPAVTGPRLLEIVSDLYRDGVTWQPGARELLLAVRKAGLRTALVTSSPRRLVDLALATLGRESLDVTVAGDEVTHCKPDPEPYETAMQALGLTSRECVAIEDTSSGATAAVRAGLSVLVVPSAPVAPGPARTMVDSLGSASVGLLRAVHSGFAAGPSQVPSTELPRRVAKPWGYELWYAHTDRYAGKILHVDAGHRLSLQYHQRKDETSYLLSGRLQLVKGPDADTLTSTELAPGQAWRNQPGEIHTIEAIEDADVLEVSTPELDDVVRLVDNYGRAGTTQH